MSTAKEIRSGGWNTPIKEMKKPFIQRIKSGYRTIKAASKKDADDYMQIHYQGRIQASLGFVYKISVKECHGNQKIKNSKEKEYFYIVTRKIIVTEGV